MFGRQFLSVILCAMIGATPINFISPTNPLTRVDSAYWRTSYTVDDLGSMAAAGTDDHAYIIKYTVDIYCSSACRIVRANYDAAPVNVTDTHVTYSFDIRVSRRKPQSMYDLMNDFTQLNANVYGMQVDTNTYTDEDEIKIMTLKTKYAGVNGVQEMWVYVEFSAEDVLTSIANDVNELNDWYFVRNFLTDHDVPSTDVQFVTNMINNDNYTQAVEYIQNYYITNSVTETQGNETIVNNYDTKETTLNNYYNTENNFTNQVETDFQNQEQQLPDINDTIQEMQVPKFLQSANWVTAQFNRMTSGNALGSLITFSLLTGFILALIGRFKK